MVDLAYVNAFAHDLDRLAGFYRDLLGLEEIVESRAITFRGFRGGGCNLGFSTPEIYDLLALPKPQDEGVKMFLTWNVPLRADVDKLTERAVALGAQLTRSPFQTAYGWYLSTLLDPEGNAFRINTTSA